jgi:hypothetical protein
MQSLHLNNLWTLAIALLWLYLIVVACVFTTLFGITFVRHLPLMAVMTYRKLQHQTPASLTMLELTFPADVRKSAYATNQNIAVGCLGARSWPYGPALSWLQPAP